MEYVVFGIFACLIPSLLFLLAAWVDRLLFRRSEEQQLIEYLRRMGNS